MSTAVTVLILGLSQCPTGRSSILPAWTCLRRKAQQDTADHVWLSRQQLWQNHKEITCNLRNPNRKKNNISYIQLHWTDLCSIAWWEVSEGSCPYCHTATGHYGCPDERVAQKCCYMFIASLYLWQFHLGSLLKIILLNRIYHKLCVCHWTIQNPVEKYEASAVWDNLSPTIAKRFKLT